jgi:hypothetical protein
LVSGLSRDAGKNGQVSLQISEDLTEPDRKDFVLLKATSHPAARKQRINKDRDPDVVQTDLVGLETIVDEIFGRMWQDQIVQQERSYSILLPVDR